MTSQVQLVQQELKKNLNIDVKITKLDYTTYYGRYVESKWEGMSWGFQSGHAIGVDERTYQYMHSKSTKNFFRVNDPVIDELTTKLRRTPDRAEQRAVAKKIVDREYDQVLRLWMPYDNGFLLFQPHMRNASAPALRRSDGYGSPTLARTLARQVGGTRSRSVYKYVLRRLLLAVPVLLLSSLIVFGLMRVMPGDALTALMAESGNVGEKELKKLRKDLGLDLPYYQQYLVWVWQMVSLNPGDSIFTNEPIPVALRKAIPVTLELATLAMILGLVIAIPVGVLSATRQDSAPDYVGRVVAVSGLSMPEFWLGTLVITFAAIWFHWIPPIGYVSFFDSPWKNLQQFLVPAAILGFRLSAATMRMTRSTVLEVLREDYVRTAWAKGLAGKIVVYKHALKNALIPVVTIVGGQLGVLLAGTVVVETIFALPGMGRLTVEAILYRDYPVVQTNVMLVAGTLVTLNLLVDMTYAWLDPRIRYQ